MAWTEIHETLLQKFNQNLDDYQRQIWSMTATQIYVLAKGIAATGFRYNQIIGNLEGWPVDDLEYLLRFKNPLEVVRDQWMSEQNINHSESISHALWELRDKCTAEADYEMDPSWKPKPDFFSAPNMS